MPLLPEGSSTSRCQCSSIHCLRCKLLIVQFRYLPSGVSDTGYGDQGLQRSTIKPHLSANSCKASSSEFTAAAGKGRDQRCATATNSVLLTECSSHKVPHPVASWRRGGAIAITARSISRRRIRSSIHEYSVSGDANLTGGDRDCRRVRATATGPRGVGSFSAGVAVFLHAPVRVMGSFQSQLGRGPSCFSVRPWLLVA